MEEVASLQSGSQEFCLRWNNFHSSLITALDGFKNDADFVDVTLACEGQFLKAHKMLLSACSVFFRDLLKANPCQHPIVILPPEVRFIDLEKMLRFIYQGEVNVQQENLARFLKTAEMLKIRGLAEDSEKQKVLHSSSPRPPEIGVERSIDIAASPKRPRLSVEGQNNTSSEAPQTPNDDGRQSRSGGDSDSEMLPVKQEMVELKLDCDFDSEVDADILLPEAYLRESPIATTSSNLSLSSQPLKSHPSAPPPPGPLLPSYVPPPQIKAPDESPAIQNQEELPQGPIYLSEERVSTRSVARPTYNGEELSIDKKWSPGQTPKSTNWPGVTRGRSRGTGRSPTFMASLSPSPTTMSIADVAAKACGVPMDMLPSTAASTSTSPFTSPASTGPSPTGSSKSIWHPPPNGETYTAIGTLGNHISIHPISSSAMPTLVCDICLKTFTSRSNLNKHKRVQHSGEEYLCPICQRRFRSRYYIKDHVNLCAAGQGKRIVQEAHQGGSNGEIDEVGQNTDPERRGAHDGRGGLGMQYESPDEKMKFEDEWIPNLPSFPKVNSSGEIRDEQEENRLLMMRETRRNSS